MASIAPCVASALKVDVALHPAQLVFLGTKGVVLVPQGLAEPAGEFRFVFVHLFAPVHGAALLSEDGAGSDAAPCTGATVSLGRSLPGVSGVTGVSGVCVHEGTSFGAAVLWGAHRCKQTSDIPDTSARQPVSVPRLIGSATPGCWRLTRLQWLPP